VTSLEAVFRIANFGAVVGWIVLVLAALLNWRGALQKFCGGLVPLLMAASYVVLIVTHWGGATGDFSSLAGLGAMARQPSVLLAGWLHYLAFDLLVGVMIVERFLDDRMPRILLLPVLPLTFFFGPAGWLVFQAIRFARRESGAPVTPPAPVKTPRKRNAAQGSRVVTEKNRAASE
jgi:hypothetical protein